VAGLVAGTLLVPPTCEARLLPRLSLPDGINLGLQSSNASVDYRTGALTMGLNVLLTPLGSAQYFDPAFRMGAAFLDNGHLQVGWLLGAETDTTMATPTYDPVTGQRTVSPFQPHAWNWEAGFGLSLYQDFTPTPGVDLKVHFDPALTVTLDSNRSVTMGRSFGYELGVEVNHAFDLQFQNAPILQTSMIGIRTHL
jgi:hypothetical protein